ncbi:hypothetical protein IAU60_002975 [Kwoniella sp. DSM 27419]
MVTPSTPKVAPIKLKLNLGGGKPAPSTPFPATSTSLRVKHEGDDENVRDEIQYTPVTKGVTRPVKAADAGPVTEPGPHDTEADGKPDAGPSSLRLNVPDTPEAQATVRDPATPLPSTPVTTAKPRGRPSTSKRVAKFTPKSRLNKAKAAARRPSAIPSRLLSEASTPVRSSASLPETPSSVNDTPVKVEASEPTSPDPLSLPVSPSAYAGDGPVTPHNEDTFDTPLTGRGRGGGRWMRVKRPLKELLNKIMVEIRKKDDYALFEEPVDLEVFPDYLAVIGGEDKMMDMGTMQSKVDNGEYRSIEQIEADLKLLVEAAQKFNPPGSVPYSSAVRIHTVGMKHIERSKPLVLTPSPSPTRASATPYRAGSVLSGREGTAALEDSKRALEELPPTSYIPEQMLDFPPNSLEALAVGWNLNGGKRVHPKRIIRTREKFGGKWRHWDLDGTRDVAEMEDIGNLVDNWRSRQGESSRKTIDWRGLKDTGTWWESDTAAAGPSTVAGQPPVPFAPYAPRRDKVTERELGATSWGLYPEIDHEVKFIRKRTGISSQTMDILAEHIRPLVPRKSRNNLPNPPNFVNIYETPLLPRSASQWLRTMCTGDTQGEAYIASVDRFVKGAMDVAKGANDEKDGIADPDRLPLDEYVYEHYQDGVLSRAAASNSVADIYKRLQPTVDGRPAWAAESAQAAYARMALRDMALPSNPMDIKPLLRKESDFLHFGVGGKNGIDKGLAWVGDELIKLDNKLRNKGDGMGSGKEEDEAKRKRTSDMMEIEGVDAKRVKVDPAPSTASSPLSAAPDSPKAKDEVNGSISGGAAGLAPVKEEREARSTVAISDEEARQLRLELVALSKFYPLPALKKMKWADASRLLPSNVRELMTVDAEKHLAKAKPKAK